MNGAVHYANAILHYTGYTDVIAIGVTGFKNDSGKVGLLSLTQEEIEKLKERREREIDASLVKLNNDIYQNEKGLGENDRVYLVAASIMATLGDVEHNVYPLKKSDLISSDEKDNTDGDIMVRKIKAFLAAKSFPKIKEI